MNSDIQDVKSKLHDLGEQEQFETAAAIWPKLL